MKQTRKIVVLSIALGAAALFGYRFRNSSTPVKVDSGHQMIMGTFARIVVMAPDEATGRAGIRKAIEAQKQVDQLMSYHRDDSELAQINSHAYERPVKIHAQTLAVMQKALEISVQSQGAFDVTVGPRLDLSKRAAEENTPPSAEAIQKALAKVGWNKLVLDPNESTIRFTVPGMRIDLGGIAKGFAIDQSIRALQEHGALGAMVDIGGDIRCFGQAPAGKQHWSIGLQDPQVSAEDTDPQRILLILKLTDLAITTSGHYRRFTIIDGQKTSHIIDPHTGQGSDKLSSVTIMAPDAITADALATAVSVLGQEQGLALIEQIPQVEAIVIGNNSSQTIKTSGAHRHVK
jgi:FAD:protein FMN transferase